MKFKFYFFKENTRNFDRADLLEYLNETKYITLDMETREAEKIAYYINDDISLNAEVIISNKSAISSSRVSSSYLDVNIRVEIDLLYPVYKFGKILNIVETMCKRYDLVIYTEAFNDATPFDRALCIKAYQFFKSQYKNQHPEEFMQYSKMESNVLEHVYQFIEQKEYLKEKYKDSNAEPVEFEFYRKSGSRNTFVAAKWDSLNPFIIPQDTQLFIYDDGIIRKVMKFQDIQNNFNKYFDILDAGLFTIYMLEPSAVKKVRKAITKGKYPEVQQALKSVELKNILDI